MEHDGNSDSNWGLCVWNVQKRIEKSIRTTANQSKNQNQVDVFE